MSRRLLIVIGILFCSTLNVSAQAPSSDAIKAAKSLVVTMRLPDQYKALLPAVLFRIKPVVTQGRPEMERDFDIIATTAGDAYEPFYNEMLEQAAAVYASHFTVDEMQQLDAFFNQAVGKRLLENWPAIAQQTAQIGQDVSRKAAEDLQLRFMEALRQKGHKL